MIQEISFVGPAKDPFWYVSAHFCWENNQVQKLKNVVFVSNN